MVGVALGGLALAALSALSPRPKPASLAPVDQTDPLDTALVTVLVEPARFAAMRARVLEVAEGGTTSASRVKAARVLAQAGASEAAALARAWLVAPEVELRRAAPALLVQTASAGSPPSGILRALSDRDDGVRGAAIDALRVLGDRAAVSGLCARLGDDSPALRARAAEALGGLGDVRALFPLVERLRDPTPTTRTAVAHALGALGDARALPALLSLVSEPAMDAQGAALEAIGRIGGPAATAMLGEQLRGTRAYYAIRGLAQALKRPGSEAASALVLETMRNGSVGVLDVLPFGEPVACAIARTRLADPDSSGSDAIALVRGLGRCHDDDAATAAALLGELRRRRMPAETIVAALPERAGPAAELALAAALEAPEVSVRRAAAAALGRIATPAAAETLEAALSDDDDDVVAGAAEALGHAGGPGQVARLLALAGRREAARALPSALALGALSARGAAPADGDSPALAHLLVHPLEPVRTIALGVALPPRPSLRRPLEAALVERPSAEALVALAAIGGALGPQARRAIGRALDDQDPTLAAAALRALARTAPDETRARIGPLRGTAAGALRTTVIALSGELRDRGALAFLLAETRGADAAEAAWALGKLGDAAAAPRLRAMLQDDAETAACAAAALGRLGQTAGLEAATRSAHPRLIANARRALSGSPAPTGDGLGVLALTDAGGQPLALRRVVLVTPDGYQRLVRTDRAGVLIEGGLPAGKLDAVLPPR